MKSKIAGLFLLTGCYVPPSVCKIEQTSQSGMYNMVLEESEGDCGPIGEIDIQISNGIPLIDSTSGCTLEKYEWTQRDCYSESSFYCEDNLWYMELDWVVVSDRSDPNVLNGALSSYMARTSGFYSCQSEYTFSAHKTQEDTDDK